MSNTAISNAGAIAQLDALVDLLDGGASAGYVNVYDDSAAQPSGPDESVPAGSVLLSEHTLSDPAFGDASDNNPGPRPLRTQSQMIPTRIMTGPRLGSGRLILPVMPSSTATFPKVGVAGT